MEDMCVNTIYEKKIEIMNDIYLLCRFYFNDGDIETIKKTVAGKTVEEKMIRSFKGYYVSVTPVVKNGDFVSYDLYSSVNRCILACTKRMKKYKNVALAESIKIMPELINCVLYEKGYAIEVNFGGWQAA